MSDNHINLARMSSLKQELLENERSAIKDALTATDGNIRAAAKILEIGQSTMQDKVRRMYPDLGEYADGLKDKRGTARRGRIASRTGALSKKKLQRAWKQHRTIAATARALKKPAATIRMVLIEYGLHHPVSRKQDLITVECSACDQQFEVSSLPTTIPGHDDDGKPCRGSHRVCECEAT